MSRRIEDLHPDCQAKYNAFKDEVERQGLDFLTTCTWRSNAEQEALYAIGRTKPGRKVTNARAGMSNHNFMLGGKPASLAFDIVPVRNGKLLVWGVQGNGLDNNPTDDDTDDLELWQRFGLIGKSVGLAWAGDWTGNMREFPHLELADAAQRRKLGSL